MRRLALQTFLASTVAATLVFAAASSAADSAQAVPQTQCRVMPASNWAPWRMHTTGTRQPQRYVWRQSGLVTWGCSGVLPERTATSRFFAHSIGLSVECATNAKGFQGLNVRWSRAQREHPGGKMQVGRVPVVVFYDDEDLATFVAFRGRDWYASLRSSSTTAFIENSGGGDPTPGIDPTPASIVLAFARKAISRVSCARA